MNEADVESALCKLMSLDTIELKDTHARRVMKRIQSFEKDERVVFFPTVILALSPRLLAKVKRAGYEELTKHITSIVVQLEMIVMKVCQRLLSHDVAEFRRLAIPCHPGLPPLMGQLEMVQETQNISKLRGSDVIPE
jgi:hypothetical protein